MVFVLIAILVFVLQYFWHTEVWSIAVVSLVVGSFLGRSAWGSFFSAFFAVFLVWSTVAFWKDIQNDQILSARIATMFGLSTMGEWLFAVTGVIGGILGAFSSLTGYYIKRIFFVPPPESSITGK